ncbi:MAG TPA: hypothetical protein VGV15_16750 [Terriglobales bacterium]|nr:hypothetical protein [Terriglobales bacterium]
MEKAQEERARKLINRLEATGSDCGLLAIKGMVVMRSPAAPYTDTPTTFDEADLQNAIALSLLERKTAEYRWRNGCRRWEWYVSKRKQPKTGDWIIFSNDLCRRIDGIEQGIAFYGEENNDLVPLVNLVPASNAEPDCWEVDSSR